MRCLTGALPAMGKSKKTTPMMEQYWHYRGEVPDDALLLFRLGDFYEMFHKDAEEGARLLDITLTKRQNYPMAGIPYHAMDAYLPKLLQAGKKVAIVEQVETPKPGKLVKRALTRILTPGTTLEEHQLEASHNHYLFALTINKGSFHTAWLDVSTGDFQIATLNNAADFMSLLAAIEPRELLLPEQASAQWAHDATLQSWHEAFDAWRSHHTVTEIADIDFATRHASQLLCETLGVLTLDGFGIAATHPAVRAAAALILYTEQTLCKRPANLSRLREYRTDQSLRVDPATQRNLEIFRSAQGTRQGSLLDAMDATTTAAGARMLERWLTEPLLELVPLQSQQETVRELIEEPRAASDAREHLKRIRDLERILGRLQNRIRNPRELGAIRETLQQLPKLREALQPCLGIRIQQIITDLPDFTALETYLQSALVDELPANLNDGNVFRDGFDATLDQLRQHAHDNKTWVSQLEAEQREVTGIKNLKVKYNGAFGYFIEVTKANLAQVPEHYIRRQTTVNAERFVTDTLRQKEKEILHADEKALAKETELFQACIEHILEFAEPLKTAAQRIAELDVLVGWAQLAREWDYCCPVLSDNDTLNIVEGRHPVIEQRLREEAHGLAGTHSFVPNNTYLAASQEQIALITGPNMAGKSTYIRQVALLTLMAHVGCWIPAKSAQIGLTDRIFSRVGASDELARGNSTFMVEMNETANILNNATDKSLIILDEIGRGTSTYDGLSIAWAVIEHLHGSATAGPKTLFATHYHEVTRLEGSLPRLRNYHVSVKEWNDAIVFVRQVIPGTADRSYGIQVARLAGLPQSVIERAKAVLEELENEGSQMRDHLAEPRQKSFRNKRSVEPEATPQLPLFPDT